MNGGKTEEAKNKRKIIIEAHRNVTQMGLEMKKFWHFETMNQWVYNGFFTVTLQNWEC
jgi:hypothetical protein